MRSGDSTVKNLIAVPSLGETALLLLLGRVVYRYREKLGLLKGDLASRAKLTTADIVALEQGEWDIDIVSLIAISKGLQVSLNELMSVFEEELMHAALQSQAVFEDR
ncbi:MAG TPA: helix-turn-helix transcriptional regulator [Drouetiella sp.]|jgi:transcriptional regulator with XRE-family HTH domain